MRGIRNRIYFDIRAIVTIIALMLSIGTVAQEKDKATFGGKIKEFTMKTVDFVDYVLNDVDTRYVEKNLYNLTYRLLNG